MLVTIMCALVGSGPLIAEVLYEDNFKGEAGRPLVDHVPDTVNTTKAFYQGSSRLVIDGVGRLVTNGVNHAASLPLPKINAGDVITLTADLRASGPASAYVGIGFTDGVATLSGFAELMVSVRSDGAGRVFLGNPGKGRPLYLKPANLAGANGNVTSLVRVVLTFDTGGRTLSALIGEEKVFDGPVDYSSLERLNHVTLQFASQALADALAPAFIEYLKVEVTPAQ